MIANTDIERARAVPIEDEVARRGIKLKRQGAELVGPCPVCVCGTCSICGCAPCGAPGFCQMCREVDRKARHERTKERRPTPQSTIEAILYCVQTRGLAALREPANIERLGRCDAQARAEINRRIASQRGTENA
jgi:hypothetical protein